MPCSQDGKPVRVSRTGTLTVVPHESSITKTVDIAVNVAKEGRTTGRQIGRRASRFSC
jgi:hypothetical protein